MDHARMMHLHGGKPVAGDVIIFKDKCQIVEGTWLFVFDKPRGFTYRAGQHVRMRLKGGHRFWSFASSPFQPELAFAIRLRDTPAKRSLMRLPAGAKVRIDMMPDPPPGAFLLDDTETRPAIFLCGGIGVTPAVSMIRQALWQGSTRRFVLFYACHRPSATPFLEELRSLATRYDNFVFVPTMTRLNDADIWEGERGRIDREMVARHVRDLPHAEIYLAGLHGMVRDMRALLMDAVPDASVRSEDFGDFGPKRRNSIIPLLLIAAGIAAAIALHVAPFLLWIRPGTPRIAIAAAALIVAIVAAKLIWLRRGRTRPPDRARR